MVFQVQGDADVEITKNIVNIAKEHSSTLIGEDTDLLIILQYHGEANGNPQHFRSDNQPSSIPKVDLNSIVYLNNVKSNSRQWVMCTVVIFSCIHEMCYHSIYGVGKKSVFQKIWNGHSVLHSCVTALISAGNNPTDIVSLVSQVMAIYYF